MKDEQKTGLEKLKKILGLSISELIRRAVDEFLNHHKSDNKKKK